MGTEVILFWYHLGVLRTIVSFQGENGLRGALRQAAESFKEEDIPVEDQGIIQAIETEGDSCADFIKNSRSRSTQGSSLAWSGMMYFLMPRQPTFYS